MAGLLAAQHRTRLEHALEHMSVAHCGLLDLDAAVLHGALEPEIAHHGRNHAVAGELPTRGEVGSADGLDHVAVDRVAVGVDGQQPVRIAVVRETHVRPGGNHHATQRVHVG